MEQLLEGPDWHDSKILVQLVMVLEGCRIVKMG